MTKNQKRRLIRIIVSAALFAASIPITAEYVSIGIKFAAYIVAGYDVLWKAVRNIFRGKIFDENFLMSAATVGAVGIGEYSEGVLVMILYQTGEFFQSLAVGKSRRAVSEIVDLRPSITHTERNGKIYDISPEEIEIGDIAVVYPGEKIPVDGEIVSGESALDTAALTGESMPVSVTKSDHVMSGSINLNTVLKIRADKKYTDSAAARILELVEESAEKKSKSENFITKFAKIYTPCVTLGALALAVIPSLFTGEWRIWIARALTFLVVSCPCALVISVPLSFFAGIGGATSRGILIKGACYIETLAKAKTVVFDKTGTLTRGRFEVVSVSPQEGIDEKELIGLSASAEAYSNHPIAFALKRAVCGTKYEELRPDSCTEYPGEGITAFFGNETFSVGNKKLMERLQAEVQNDFHESYETILYTAKNGKFAGYISISDTVKEGAAETVSALKKLGISRTVMLTGDAEGAAAKIAEKLGVDEYKAGLFPADKVSELERLKESEQNGSVIFAGDGINDAPVLTRADAGIAMGALGSDAAVEAADVVLMNDDIRHVADSIIIARRTMRIVWENIVFALGVKAAVLTLGALGVTGMWAAVFADVGVALIAVLNAMRAIRVRGI
ncbi:MAG: cadmium-translocating P-type ATPase [Clostridiales bacterium]|nr:cadmium-translocating P-type ATPase [Clostridiales bacterium]